MKYEYYKCLEQQYFTDGKVIDSLDENYGKHTIVPITSVKNSLDYIYRNCTETNFPLVFFCNY